MFTQTLNFGAPFEAISFRRLITYVPFFIISEVLYEISESTEDSHVKNNALKIRKRATDIFISNVSPFILHFYKWDLNRRTWKHPNDEYKIEFFQKVAGELDEELKGKRNQLAKKYIRLLLEFVFEFMDKAVQELGKVDLTNIPFPINKEEMIKMRDDFRRFLDSDELTDVIDTEAESDFFKVYAPIAKKYIEGLTDSRHR